MARAHAQHLSYTDRLGDLAACDIVYLSTDVPTNDRGESDLSVISGLVREVIPALGPKALLVILCQVPPGFTRGLPLPADRLFYQVETLVFGRAVERATKPERFIVGCADPQQPLPPPFATLLGAFGCPILPMRYESAELAKIAINCCLVASVSVANTLAELSERIGADWSEIAPALRLDRRIGAYSYLAPGLGIAGGNLERDLATVLRLSERTGSEASVVAAFVRNSRHRKDWALRVVHREVLARKPNATFGVLGLAYKENTHSTKNSPALDLIAHLKSWPIRSTTRRSGSAALHPAVTAQTPLEAARHADALVIMTLAGISRRSPRALADTMAGRVVIDRFACSSPRPRARRAGSFRARRIERKVG